MKDPGPGQYQLPPKAFDTKYKFHMGVKTVDLRKDQTPGPADYKQEVRATIKAMPSYS